MANAKKEELTILQQIKIHLSSRYEFARNIVTGETLWRKKGESGGSIMTDYDFNSLVLELDVFKLTIPVGLLRNLLNSKFVPLYDPIASYFNSLPEWDKETDYIQQLINTVKTKNDDEWSFYLKKWLVAMVACALNEKAINHTMLVFCGGQGIGKTTWVVNLLPQSLSRYMYSGTIDPNNKDTLVFLSEKLLINIDELEVLGRAQLGSLKQLITKDRVKIRRPYGTINEDLPRRASFISSVNNSEFLTDLTGNRRFLGVEVISIDYNHQVSLEGVYSQALYLWKSGFRYFFNKEEIEIVNKANEKFRIKSLVEELLFQYFSPANQESADCFLTATELLAEIFPDNKNARHNGNLQQLGKILHAHRFIKRKRAGRQEYLLKRQPQSQVDYQPQSVGSQEM